MKVIDLTEAVTLKKMKNPNNTNKLVFSKWMLCIGVLRVFCVVLCVGFRTGYFVMVPLQLNIYIVYNILSLNISSIYII